MKVCPQCDRILPDDAQVCKFCGEVLTDETAAAPATNQIVKEPVHLPEPEPEPVPTAPEPKPTAPEPKPAPAPRLISPPPAVAPAPKSNNALYIIIGVLAALLIGGAALWFLSRDKGNASVAPASPTTPQEQVDIDPVEDSGSPTNKGNNIGNSPEAPTKGGVIDDPVAPDNHVIVTGTDVRLRTSPFINNKNILKDHHGKNIHPRMGQVLRCIGDDGDFYLVEFGDNYYYISKKFAKPTQAPVN